MDSHARHYRWLLPATLGVAHAASDGSAGLLIGSLVNKVSLEQVLQLVVLYNVLAFGGQPMAGLMCDNLRRPRAAVVLGLALMTVALVMFPHRPTLAVALAGIASAVFHVGAGAIAICATEGRASGPGVFAAPGVVGLAIGGAMATAGHSSALPFIVAMAAPGVIVSLAGLPSMPYCADGKEQPMFEGHDYAMLLLLFAVAFRSAAWNIFQIAAADRMGVLITLACAGAAGKVIGGVMADRLGLRRWAIGALVAAVPFLAFGGQRLLLLLPGIALLQSATAPTMTLMARTAPRHPATAAGLALGLGIGLGGLPFAGITGARPSASIVLMVMLGAASAVALVAVLRHDRNDGSSGERALALGRALRAHGSGAPIASRTATAGEA